MTTQYVGSELALFAAATNWKGYFAHVLTPFIGTRVLEVGSGLGANICYLHGPSVHDWTSLEPDETFAQLCIRGDRALYRAKHTGRNRVCADATAASSAGEPILD